MTSVNSAKCEAWKPVVGYEGIYEVSDQGRVRRAKSGRVRKTRETRKGYRRVSLHVNNKVKLHFVHRLVLQSFVGPCPDGYETRHLDGDRKNNSLSNLRWGTKQENEYDRVLHGTVLKGSLNGMAKLTESKVKEMRRLRRDSGLPYIEIAKRYSVGCTTAHSVINRITWNHLP